MTYKIQQISPQEWETFYTQTKLSLFVQSPGYADFSKNYGDDATFFGVYKDDAMVGGSIVIHVRARRGDFMYLPYGPVLNFSNREMVKAFFDEIKKYAVSKNVVSIKVSPHIENTIENRNILALNGAKKSPLHILAERTWVLDLTPDEDTLMMGMTKKHRNLVRRAIKDGVTITQHDDQKSLQTFIDLHDEVVKRHKFTPFSSKYIKTEFASFRKEHQAKVFLAHFEGEVISSSVIMFYGNTAVYRHGASASKHARVPSSYLCLWESILEAKRQGMKYFNFWGIAPENADKKHPFYGITHFKKGFGGSERNLMPCHDIPVSWKYRAMWLIDTWRKWKRGF